MKILSKNDALRTTAYLIFFISAVLALFLPYLVAFSFRAHILFLILALLLSVTPWANRGMPADNIDLQKEVKKSAFIKCLSLTFLIQIALVMAFYTLSHLAAATLPISFEPFPLFESTFSILTLYWGLFPWGIYILMAAALTYVGYIKKQPADMSTLIRPLIKNTIGDPISLLIDTTTKVAIMLSLACTLALISVECMGLIGACFNLPVAYGLRLDVLLCMVLILQSTKSDFFKDQLSRLFKLTSPIFAVISFLCLAIVVFLCLSVLIGWLSPIFTPPLNTGLIFLPADWAAIWLIFSGIWWLSWAPLTAGMIAYVWRGYKIRTLIWGTLLLPVSAGILESAYPDWHLNISSNTHWLNLIPAILSAGIIICLFFRTQFITFSWKALLPIPWHDYRRSPKTFLKQVLTLVIVFMALYWACGIYIVGMLYFICLFLTGLFVFTVGVAVFKTACLSFFRTKQ